ncbi:hypothetical protein WA556_000747, partial [Blastocystis sp. ATCC 50177/Nand II]
MKGVIEEGASITVDHTANYQIRVQSPLTDRVITLNHDYEPNTLIESMITFVQESLKTEHSVDNVSTIRMIYRGFVLDPAKTVSEVSHERANHTQCALNPEYP